MVDTDDTRRTTDDGRRTTDDGRRTTPRVWHKLPTGELKNWYLNNIYYCLTCYKLAAKHLVLPFLLRIGRLPRSTLPLSHPRSTTCGRSWMRSMCTPSDIMITRPPKWRRIMSKYCQTSLIKDILYACVRFLDITT